MDEKKTLEDAATDNVEATIRRAGVRDALVGVLHRNRYGFAGSVSGKGIAPDFWGEAEKFLEGKVCWHWNTELSELVVTEIPDAAPV